MDRRCLLVVIVCALYAHLSPASAWPASFRFLGDPLFFGPTSQAWGVSADGSVVVGQYRNSTTGLTEAFRWTNDGGLVGLGYLPNLYGQTGRWSRANDISADGNVVVGYSIDNTFQIRNAFRWTSAGGMVRLGNHDYPYLTDTLEAFGVSADGNVVVGKGSVVVGKGGGGFRWTSEGGAEGLGDLPGGSNYSEAHDVSANGGVVVGQSISASGYEAFRWSGGGMVPLGPGDANAVSADGRVIVGASSFADSGDWGEAFRWTSQTGMVGLGEFHSPTFGVSSKANGVSADGSVVVGRGGGASHWEAFVWTPSLGMATLKNTLIAQGVTGLTDLRLIEATAISPDGKTIVGYGHFGPYNTGSERAFVATLDFPKCQPGDHFNVPLPAYNDPFPLLADKPGGPLSIAIHLSPVDVAFVVQTPTETGAVCEAIGTGSRSLDVEVSFGGVAIGTISATVAATVKVTQFEGGSAIADQARHTSNFFTGADGGYINSHTVGHDVYRWSNPEGFSIKKGPFETGTGPLEVWLDLQNAGINPDSDFDAVVYDAQQIVEAENISIVYQRESIIPKTIFAILDPGKTEMLVSDPAGRLLGMDASGVLHDELLGSAYFEELPLALIPEPMYGSYEVTLRGVETGDYELILSLISQDGIPWKRELSGFLLVGETVTYNIFLPRPGDVNADGLVNIFDINLVSARWGQSGQAGDANGDGIVNIFDINLISSNWTVPGDVNSDGLVNIFDINLVSANWGESGPAGDANGDMIVNIFDINLISANWTPTGGATAVPEPATWGLALLAALAIAPMVRRARRANQ